MDNDKLSAKNVWGKIVLYLKENKKVALHVACGDITNASIENGFLIIKSSDDFLINILEEGRRELENAIRWQGLDLKLEIVKFESQKQRQDNDISKLVKFFGEKLEIHD